MLSAAADGKLKFGAKLYIGLGISGNSRVGLGISGKTLGLGISGSVGINENGFGEKETKSLSGISSSWCICSNGDGSSKEETAKK